MDAQRRIGQRFLFNIFFYTFKMSVGSFVPHFPPSCLPSSLPPIFIFFCSPYYPFLHPSFYPFFPPSFFSFLFRILVTNTIVLSFYVFFFYFTLPSFSRLLFLVFFSFSLMAISSFFPLYVLRSSLFPPLQVLGALQSIKSIPPKKLHPRFPHRRVRSAPSLLPPPFLPPLHSRRRWIGWPRIRDTTVCVR